MVDSLTPDERETIVRIDDAEKVARIWTSRRTDITRLRKNPGAVETASGYHGTTQWAEFEIAPGNWNPASGIKRRSKPMTEEQRAAAAERLRQYREGREDD